jgi:hypothetical protein|eukprot:COSAG01_NODE_825_length_13294_cov_30.659038_9_plen_89_part_00
MDEELGDDAAVILELPMPSEVKGVALDGLIASGEVCFYELTDAFLPVEPPTEVDPACCPALAHARIATVSQLTLDEVAAAKIRERRIL